MPHLFSPQSEGDCEKIVMLLYFDDVLDSRGTLTFQRSKPSGNDVRATCYIIVTFIPGIFTLNNVHERKTSYVSF